VELEGERIERACPWIDAVLPDGSKLAVIAEISPKRGDLCQLLGDVRSVVLSERRTRGG